MQSRFAIVLMSIAGAAVLFGIGFALGLGVLSSPPPGKHKQIAVTTQPTKVARPETTGQAKAENKTADDEKTAGNDRALTPLYPVAPGGPAAQSAPDKSLAAEPAKAQEAKADAPPAPAPKDATPVSIEHRNACDVSACARAYKSFRESDCTYQPYSGPRQFCVKPPAPTEASRSQGGDGSMPRRYHRDFTADGEDDRIVVVPADEGDIAGADLSDDDQ